MSDQIGLQRFCFKHLKSKHPVETNASESIVLIEFKTKQSLSINTGWIFQGANKTKIWVAINIISFSFCVEMFGFDVLRWQIANLTLICYEGLPLKCLGAIIKTITLIFRKFLSGSTFRGVYYRFWTCWLSFPIYKGFILLLLFFKIDSTIRFPTEFPSLSPVFNNSCAISAPGGEAPRAAPRPRPGSAGSAACAGPRCPQGALGPRLAGRKPGCGGEDAAREARRLGAGSRQKRCWFLTNF